MMGMRVNWTPVSETSLMLYFGDEIDVNQAPLIGEVARRIKAEYQEVCEVTASYTSILVQVHSPRINLEEFGEKLVAMIGRSVIAEKSEGKLIELPVYYHPDVGPDLERVARNKGLTVAEVIAIHAGRDYTVCAIGFAPGFAFLADVDARIATPRHERPRAKVVAGSVGIADRQTAVYPMDTPGGWHLIGRCPVPLYDPEQIPLSPFGVGDRVRFVPVERADYIERGGHV
jgi:KipI family sensor histidine kinase inhibitor